MEYAIVIEQSADGYGAYVPDLPGCVAVGDPVAEVQELIREAIALHLKAMREDGDPIPAPATRVGYVQVAAPAPV